MAMSTAVTKMFEEAVGGFILAHSRRNDAEIEAAGVNPKALANHILKATGLKARGTVMVAR